MSKKSGSYDSIPIKGDDDDVFGDEDGEEEAGRCQCCSKLYPLGFCTELKGMFHIAWPIVLTQVCQMILGPISLIFCGHLGDPIKLDGAALAISMINATCISVGQGLGTACDTFFSQSFGSRNKKQVGIYLQRALMIFALALLACIAVHINLEFILRSFGQDPEVSRLAGDYMIIFIPGAISFFMYMVLAKYVQNQNIVIPNVVIGLGANGINALLHYIFLYELNMGTEGSAIAQAVAYFTMFFFTLLYILISGIYRETWDGWTWECLYEWGKFGRLAIPGMLMVCLEWWGFEIGVFLTGLLGTTELGAQSVLLQIDSIWFQIPLGLQIACSIRVGQYLGRGNIPGAITAARLTLTIVLALSLVMSLLFLFLRHQLAALFTNVTEVADLTASLLPIVTLYMFFDGCATACKGVLYGTGRQVIGAILLFISYYCLALPIGIPLMFLTPLRSAAYWWALAGNLVIQAAVLFFLVVRTKWESQLEEAQERAGLLGEIEEEDEEEGETTALLPDTNDRKASRGSISSTRNRYSSSSRPPIRRSRMLSVSLSRAQIAAITQELDKTVPWSEVVCRRLIVVLIMFGVLGLGITLKLLVKFHPTLLCLPANSTEASGSSLPLCNVTIPSTVPSLS